MSTVNGVPPAGTGSGTIRGSTTLPPITNTTSIPAAKGSTRRSKTNTTDSSTNSAATPTRIHGRIATSCANGLRWSSPNNRSGAANTATTSVNIAAVT